MCTCEFCSSASGDIKWLTMSNFKCSYFLGYHKDCFLRVIKHPDDYGTETLATVLAIDKELTARIECDRAIRDKVAELRDKYI